MDIPERIGAYRVVRHLGAGGMGEVFLAHDDRLGRDVAIKRLVPRGADPELQRERFRQEAAILGRLEKHAHIVKVHHTLEHEGVMHIVMEYVDGQTLRQRVAQGALPVGEGVRLALQIAAGMSAAHKEGIVHRDLKSENVLLDRDGNAKITDFGVAKVLGDMTLTQDGQSVGTLKAMSPEQLRGKRVTEASDLFSFGILLHEVLTGELPFKGDGFDIIESIKSHTPPALSTRVPGVPDALSHLVGLLLQKHASMRPGIRDVIDRLKRIEANLSDETAALTAPPVPPGVMDDDATEDVVPLSAHATESAHAETPADPGARMRRPPHRTSSQQLAAGEPDNGPLTHASRRRWLAGAFAGAGVILAVVLAYGSWPLEPAPRVEWRKIAVLTPEVPKDCAHERRGITIAVRNAMEEPLFRFDGVFVVSENGEESLSMTAQAVADELLAATVICHPGYLTIEIQRKQADGTVLGPSRTFTLDISDLGRLETIQANVGTLYQDMKTRPDASSRGQARPEDVEEFQRLRKAHWLAELSREQVLDGLERIRTSSPAFLDAHMLTAELLMYRAEPEYLDEAWQIMQQAKRIAPDWHPVLSRLFTIALARHDMKGASEVLAEIEALDPGDAFTYYLRGLLYEDAQDTGRARDAMQTASERHPSWRILYHLAKLNMAVCDIDAAQDVFATLREKNLENATTRALQGKLLSRLDPGAAIRAYESVPVSLAREPAEHFNHAINLMIVGRYADARALILQTMEQHQNRRNDLGATYTLAELERLLGEDESADTRFAKVLERVSPDEHEADVMVARAMVLAHQGQFDDARKAIASALKRDDMEIFYSAAAVYALIDDTDEAARWATRALDCGYAREWFHFPWFEAVTRTPQLSERLGAGAASPAR